MKIFGALKHFFGALLGLVVLVVCYVLKIERW